MSVEVRPEQGSFRDPNSRIFYSGDGVLRALTEEALADWDALTASALYGRFAAEGKLVATERIDPPPDLPPLLKRDTAAVLRHEAIPFVSYPYEWTFGMLRDAALLQLELLRAAVDEDLILKDSSPYNVQWRGTRPVFIDLGSFERLAEGEPWVGYRQFCMLFLYPLLLQAYKGVDFRPWLRGSIDGIEPEQMASLMTRRDLARPGVLAHVYLHSRLQAKYGDTKRDVKGELREAGFGKELVKANLAKLTKVVRGLSWELPRSEWSGYSTTATYTEADAERKAAFVREAVGTRDWSLAWDIGCNDGTFSRIAAERAAYVLAMDADHAVVERLYRALRDEGATTVLPLVENVADPSPGLGWRGLERKPLPDRGLPELTLCLALIHHVAITHNIPVADFLGWLAGLGTHLVIEFVTPEDPMAARLLAAKRPGTHPDYTTEFFERALGETFDVERREELADGTRLLYFARPRR